jgi:LAO/AO transport system kinase
VTAQLNAHIDGAKAGNIRDIARLLTAVENDSSAAHVIAAAFASEQHTLRVLGITGPPGVGKSTTTSALITHYRSRGKRVAVLAVDPSSPFSGGALLGDRVRMQTHASDSAVFIRSMAARGHLGGLSSAVPLAITVLGGCGFDVLILETVGVGQSEIDVARMADTTVLVLAPGFGDGIQAAKAGIMEIADVFAVNKSDRDGADATVRELRAVIALGTWHGWVPPVLKLQAHTGVGIAELADAVEQHWAWLDSSGAGQLRLRTRIDDQLRNVVMAQVAQSMVDLDPYVDDIQAGRTTPYAAADAVVAALRDAR